MLFQDMALSRNNAMKRCMDLSKNFIEHFDKIYNSPISDAKKMELLIPDAGLITIPGAGHFSYLDNCNYFLLIVNKFLEECD